MRRFKAAVVQMDSGNNRESNRKKIQRAVETAKHMGAELIVLPETVDYIGCDFTRNSWDTQNAKQFLGNLAKTYHVFLHGGSITETTMGKPRNTTMFFTPEGTCMGAYSKLHMFDVQMGQDAIYRESSEIQAGNKLAVARTPLAVFGFAICYDIRFAEIFRLMALCGAEVFCVCANFTMTSGKDHWETLLRARAIENTCYVIAANQIGVKPKFTAYGNSMIIDPWGNVIARCSNREEVITADIDLDYVKQVREQLPSLTNLRNDIYHLEGDVDQWK